MVYGTFIAIDIETVRFLSTLKVKNDILYVFGTYTVCKVYTINYTYTYTHRFSRSGRLINIHQHLRAISEYIIKEAKLYTETNKGGRL